MSRLVDKQRREDALQAKIERSKEHRRQLDRVAALTADGVSKSEQARRLGVSRKEVLWLHVCAALADRGELTSAIRWRLRGAAKREVRDGCEAET